MAKTPASQPQSGALDELLKQKSDIEVKIREAKKAQIAPLKQKITEAFAAIQKDIANIKEVDVNYTAPWEKSKLKVDTAIRQAIIDAETGITEADIIANVLALSEKFTGEKIKTSLSKRQGKWFVLKDKKFFPKPVEEKD
jgi:hypothetical protein